MLLHVDLFKLPSSGFPLLDQRIFYASIGVIGCSFSFKQTKSSWISKLGMKYALFVYIYHILILEIFKAFDIDGIIILLLPFLVITFSILIAMILERKLPKIYNILNGEFK